jgi:cytochrome oxidase Cu insertion factor (SCO1/SenC/PrrC family)
VRGRPALVTFAFGHCETICPAIVKQVVTAQAELADNGTPVGVLIVTVDPWRDLPSRLPFIADAWDLPARDAWVLSGEVATVERTLDAWGVARARDLRNGEVTHPSLVYVIDTRGRIAFATTGGTAVLRELVERL